MPIDYKNYPPDWKARRQRILARAEHRCEHCGLQNYALVDSKTRTVDFQATSYKEAREMKPHYEWCVIVILTVAHLDQDEWNHDVHDDRLAALCQKCHFANDRQDNILRKKYGKQWKKNQLTIQI